MSINALQSFLQRTINTKRFLRNALLEIGLQVVAIAFLNYLFCHRGYVLKMDKAIWYVIYSDYISITLNFTSIGKVLYYSLRVFPFLFTVFIIARWLWKKFSIIFKSVNYYFNASLFTHSDNSFLAEVFAQLTITFGVFTAAYFVLTSYVAFGTDAFYADVIVLSRLMILILFIQLVKSIYAHYASLQLILSTYFNAKEQPYALAIFRIIYTTFLLMGMGWPIHTLSHWAELGKADRVALPFIGFIVDAMPINKELYLFFCNIVIVSAIGLLLGLFTRLSAIVLTLSSFYIWAIPCFFGKLNHNQVQCWTILILALSNSGSVLSIDSLIRKYIFKQKTNTEPRRAFALPFRFIWLMLGIMYFFSGVHKIWDHGLCWALSDHFVFQIQEEWLENFNRIPGFRIDHFPVLAKTLGMATIYFELVYIFFVLSPYTRWMAAFGGIALHQSANYFMNIGFENIQQVYVSFINWNKVLSQKIKNKLASFYSTGHDTATLISTTPLIIIISTLLIGNSICGVFQIHTWPFSAYPSYSNLAPGTSKTLKIIANDSIDVDSIMQAKHFRKENYRKFETEIADLSSSPAQQTIAIEKLWKKYQTSVPSLQNFQKIVVYQDSISLNPDLPNKLLGRKRLYSYPKAI